MIIFENNLIAVHVLNMECYENPWLKSHYYLQLVG